MPADRTQATSTSFAAAAATPGAVKLSSHGKQHAPTLQRGQACRVCRSRKIRCDGSKPTCSPCAKSARAHGEEPIPCDFTEPPRKRRPNNYKLAELEDKLEEMKKQLAATSPPAPAQPPTATPLPTPQPPPFVPYSHPLPFSALGGQQPISSSQSNFIPSVQPFDTSAFNLGAGNLDFEATFNFSSSLLLPYGWSTDLPTPFFLNRLLDVFFTKSHFGSDIITEDRFRASMTLPPTHIAYPPRCLLHAIAAATSHLVSDSFIAEDTRFWLSRQEFGDWHSEKAKSLLESSFAAAQGSARLRVVQAACLISHHEYTSAHFAKAWLSTGVASRFATSLGLQHVRNIKPGPDGANGRRAVKGGMLPLSDDPVELAERAATFNVIWAGDVVASASTGWAQALDGQAVTTLIPPPKGFDYPTEDLINSPLCHLSPSFFMTFPPHLCGSQQIYFKTWYLLSRVCSYLNRAPEPIGLGLPLPLVDGESQDLRMLSAFKRLDSDITQFRLSLPREYQRIDQLFQNDQRRISIISIPQFACILLHEPFCGFDETDPSMQKCTLAARAIMDTIHALLGSSSEVVGLAPFLNLIWGVAGRILVRQLALRQIRQTPFGVNELTHDVKSILAALEKYPSPIGASNSLVLSRLLADPILALPPGPAGDCFNGPGKRQQLGGLPSSAPFTPPSDTSSITSPNFSASGAGDYTELYINSNNTRQDSGPQLAELFTTDLPDSSTNGQPWPAGL